jgi:hypothetical protein
MRSIDPKAYDAVLAVHLAYESYVSAPTRVQQAYALIALNDAMGDLATWLPGYDVDTGTVAELPEATCAPEDAS